MTEPGNDRTREWPNPGMTEPGNDRTREWPNPGSSGSVHAYSGEKVSVGKSGTFKRFIKWYALKSFLMIRDLWSSPGPGTKILVFTGTGTGTLIFCLPGPGPGPKFSSCFRSFFLYQKLNFAFRYLWSDRIKFSSLIRSRTSFECNKKNMGKTIS